MLIQVFKTRLGIYLLLINILLFFASCGENTPLEPSIKEILSYFPLAEGKQWEYEYSYENTFYRDDLICITDSIHNFKGTFLLTVLKVDNLNQGDNEGTFFTLSATFEIEKEQYGYVRTCVPPWTSFDSSYTRENFTVSTDYYLMLRDGSLWYVKNAASPGSTPVDSTTLMMENPSDTLSGPGKVNLKMFNYPGIDLFPFIGIPPADFSVNIIENKGVKDITFIRGEQHLRMLWLEKVKYELIED